MKGKALLLGALLLGLTMVTPVSANVVDEALYACQDKETIYTIYIGMDPHEALETFDNLPDWQKDKAVNNGYYRILEDGTRETFVIGWPYQTNLNEFDLWFDTPTYGKAVETFMKLKKKMTDAYGRPSHFTNEVSGMTFSYDNDEQVATYYVGVSKKTDGTGHLGIKVYHPTIHKQSYDHSKYGICGR